ncbi:signal peptidase I [Microbacterium sp. NPDC055903]
MSARRGGQVRRVLTWAVLFLVCALAFLTVVVPLVLGAQSYTVLTGSMRPGIPPGALIAVRDAPIHDIRVGDVITYQLRSGEPEVVTHRVVGTGVDGAGERILTTKGDDNNVADEEPVRDVQIRGVVVYAIPWLGYLSIWATPSIKSIVVTVIGVSAIGWGAWMLMKDARRRRRAKAAAGAVSAILLGALSMTLLPATPAEAAAPAGFLRLSADGITWSEGPELTLLEGASILAPGDRFEVDLWVRNASADTASFSIESAWSADDDADPRDRALAAALTAAPTAQEGTLGPGESRRVPIRVAFDTRSDLSSTRAAADLAITITLTEVVGAVPPSQDPLAQTGSGFSVLLASSAAALIAGGAAALAIAERRNRRTRKGTAVPSQRSQA